MKRLIGIILAIGFAAVLAVAGLADDTARNDEPSARISIVYLDHVSSGERGAIRASMTRTSMATLQREIAADRALHRKFQVRGINLRNIVSRSAAVNGAMIYYIR